MYTKIQINIFQIDFYLRIVLVDIHTLIFHSQQDLETVSLTLYYYKLCKLNLNFILKGIGQKFAILEEKSIISSVLRHYKIEAVDRREDLTLLGELILRPKDGLLVKITPRS
jgi:hypothetical protein